MPDSFRLRVMKSVTEALKMITPANGYDHDFGDFTDSAGRPSARVFRGRTMYGENDPLPMLSILEDPRAEPAVNGPMANSKAQNVFKLLIQGFAQDDKDNPLDPAYALSAEVIKAIIVAAQSSTGLIGLNQQKRAPCIMGVSIGQPVHRPGGDEISDHAYFLVGLTLTLTEDLTNPFAA